MHSGKRIPIDRRVEFRRDKEPARRGMLGTVVHAEPEEGLYVVELRRGELVAVYREDIAPVS